MFNRKLWKAEAEKYGADLERVQVWQAVSELYQGSYLAGDDFERIADVLSRSPFSEEELLYIEIFEVRPACFPKISWLLNVASFLFARDYAIFPSGLPGKWDGFSPDWLIPRCLTEQQKHPFQPTSALGWKQRLVLHLSWSNLPFQRIKTFRGQG